MSLRVVVYAEGTGETGGSAGRKAPGQELSDEELGAAHILVRRCLSSGARIPAAAVRFHEPLRTPVGHVVARGSDLYNVRTLRKLLTWFRDPPAPDVAVVLIDADGDRSRKRVLDEGTATVGPSARLGRVIGVAVEEFEAWLIADDARVAAALHSTFATTRAPETMGRREAKELLAAATASAGADTHELRRTIAELCDLDVVAARCPAFASFRGELVQTAFPATFGP